MKQCLLLSCGSKGRRRYCRCCLAPGRTQCSHLKLLQSPSRTCDDDEGYGMDQRSLGQLLLRKHTRPDCIQLFQGHETKRAVKRKEMRMQNEQFLVRYNRDTYGV